MEWNETTAATLREKLATAPAEDGTLTSEVVAWLRDAGVATVPFLINSLADANLAPQAQKALLLFPRSAVPALVAELNGDYCNRFRRESRGPDDWKTCQSACDLLGDSLIAIADQAQAEADQDTLDLLGAKATEVIRAYHDRGCGSARYQCEDVIPAFGLAALPAARIWPSFAWDELEAVFRQGVNAIPALFRAANSCVGKLFPNFVANACARYGDAAVPALAAELGVSKVGMGKAAALSLVRIGSESAVSALFESMEASPTEGNSFDICMEVFRLDKAGRANMDLVLSRALSGEPSPNRILAAALLAHGLGKHAPRTQQELRRVRPLCGVQTYIRFGKDTPITEAVDDALRRTN